jgi:plasmid stability protein
MHRIPECSERGGATSRPAQERPNQTHQRDDPGAMVLVEKVLALPFPGRFQVGQSPFSAIRGSPFGQTRLRISSRFLKHLAVPTTENTPSPTVVRSRSGEQKTCSTSHFSVCLHNASIAKESLIMPNVLVRDVDETILTKLKDQAQRNGRSLQSEVLAILTNFVSSNTLSDEETATRIKDALRGRMFSDSAALLREDRER